MSTRACAFLLATVTSLGVVIPANAAGPSMSGGSTGNQFGPTWNWSVTVPWDYGYGSGPRYCQTGRWVWDPYIGRRVWVRQAYAC